MEYFAREHRELVEKDVLDGIDFQKSYFMNVGYSWSLRGNLSSEQSKKLKEKLLEHPIIKTKVELMVKNFEEISKQFPMLLVCSNRLTLEQQNKLISEYIEKCKGEMKCTN